MASDEALAQVKQALLEGANPSGFSGENAVAFQELLDKGAKQDNGKWVLPKR